MIAPTTLPATGMVGMLFPPLLKTVPRVGLTGEVDIDAAVCWYVDCRVLVMAKPDVVSPATVEAVCVTVIAAMIVIVATV